MTADAVGGIWTYAADLAGALAARGNAVTLAVLGPGPDDAQRHVAADGGFALVDLGHPPEWLADGPAAVAQGGNALASLARETSADLVHLNHPALGADAPFACPTLAVCHSCVATWWAAVRGTSLPTDFAWQADRVGAGYRAATALVAPTRAFAQATREAYDLGRGPEVVFNGRTAWPMKHGTSEPSVGGLTVGRLWDEGKDVATLERAAALASVPLSAVGPTSGPNGASIALRHISAGGPASEAEVRALLAERPVFLSAARYEPFGLSVLEAAQAGCALVLSDIPTFRELWEDTAEFVAPGDAAGFAATLDRLSRDPHLRAQRGAAAADRAGRFTLDAAVERVVTIYAALVGRTGPEAGDAGLASRNGVAA